MVTHRFLRRFAGREAAPAGVLLIGVSRTASRRAAPPCEPWRTYSPFPRVQGGPGRRLRLESLTQAVQRSV